MSSSFRQEDCLCFRMITIAHLITILKGTATLMISMFYQQELYEPWLLIQVSSKSVENGASYGHLKIQYGQHFAAILNI